MRLRLAVLVTLVTTLAAFAVTSVASAAPGHNRGLTINAIPNPIDAGEGVFIYGHLNVGPVGGQTIILYHHLAGTNLGYTKVGQTTTDSRGFYEFTRAEDVVLTNRSWFVREQGAHFIHSRTVSERVAALVSIAASTTMTTDRVSRSRSPERSPRITPASASSSRRRPSPADWRDLKAGRLDGGSNYSITYGLAVRRRPHRPRPVPARCAQHRGRLGHGHGRGPAEAGARVHDRELRSADLLRSVGHDLGRAR